MRSDRGLDLAAHNDDLTCQSGVARSETGAARCRRMTIRQISGPHEDVGDATTPLTVHGVA
jgi:hypothetical protein